MHLEELLKKENQKREVEKKRLDDAKAKSQADAQHFRKYVPAFFKEKLGPLVKDTVSTFNENGFPANMGQAVHAADYPDTSNIVSFSVADKKKGMQIDITASIELQRITLAATFTNKDLNFQDSYVLNSILEADIEKSIEKAAEKLIKSKN